MASQTVQGPRGQGYEEDEPTAIREETEHPSGSWRPALLTALIALAIGVGFAWWLLRDQGQGAGSSSESSDSSRKRASTPVQVVHPHRGGISRTTSQPGIVHAFESADLHAKASGYLRAQIVDIGDTVTRGQVLAEVFDPERQQAVEEAAAAVEQAKAQIDQAEAAVVAAEAEVRAAEAVVQEKKAEVDQNIATRKRTEKEYLRYQELADREVVDARVVDEKQEAFESARAGEAVALAAVASAEGRLAKAEAGIVTAKADVKAARANLLAAEARLSRAEILAGYTDLTSPYNGVVTSRNYHRGDFIREATGGDSPAVLSVARTDLMRVVIYVPDRDVPYLDRGDRAVVRVDALGGEEFEGTVSRYSDMEMAANRSMRAEVDLPNPSGRLKDGMYGMTSILLEAPDEEILTVPSSALVSTSDSGGGAVYVVIGGKASRRDVRLGKDDGLRAEILSGLSTNDMVVYSYSGSIEDGVSVEVGGDAMADAGGNQAGKGS